MYIEVQCTPQHEQYTCPLNKSCSNITNQILYTLPVRANYIAEDCTLTIVYTDLSNQNCTLVGDTLLLVQVSVHLYHVNYLVNLTCVHWGCIRNLSHTFIVILRHLHRFTSLQYCIKRRITIF